MEVQAYIIMLNFDLLRGGTPAPRTYVYGKPIQCMYSQRHVVHLTGPRPA